MPRTTILALAAAAALGAAALAPTTASARHGGWHGHHLGHHHYYRHWGPRYRIGFYAPSYAAYDGCYLRKRWIETAHGPRPRWVTVCY
jgi:hypothetical protein